MAPLDLAMVPPVAEEVTADVIAVHGVPDLPKAKKVKLSKYTYQEKSFPKNDAGDTRVREYLGGDPIRPH